MVSIITQVSKPKVAAERQASSSAAAEGSGNLSGMFFQRSKKSTPKSVKLAQEAAKQGGDSIEKMLA